MKLTDFEIEVESGREAVVLHLTDTQIIDATQSRTENRLGEGAREYWGADKMDARCFGYIRETVEATDPDFIILTGDLVYGEFDDKGTSLRALIEFMGNLGVPWAPIFGNHDNESVRGVDWQSRRLEEGKNCLFKQRNITGNGNYSVGIRQGGRITRVFYMLDNNCASTACEKSLVNGHTKRIYRFAEDQKAWVEDSIRELREGFPNVKISLSCHLQPYVFALALNKYGFEENGENSISIDKCENRAEGDFGYIGAGLKSAWDKDFSAWKWVKSIGADSLFVGHEHCNSASVVYEGVRLQYGQKSSTYDRFNNLLEDGSVKGQYWEIGRPLVGGTVVKLSENDGEIVDGYVYLCDNG